MKNIKTHNILALGLTMLVIVNFFPFAALHHHERKEPVCISDSGSSDQNPCSHRIHFHSKTRRCFSCEFTFVKVFMVGELIEIIPFIPAEVHRKQSALPIRHLSVVANRGRGPPVIV